MKKLMSSVIGGLCAIMALSASAAVVVLQKNGDVWTAPRTFTLPMTTHTSFTTFQFDDMTKDCVIVKQPMYVNSYGIIVKGVRKTWYCK